MATFKELLGEAYKDGMSLSEIEAAISNMKLADLSSGEYVSRGKLSDYERRAKEAEKKLAEKLTDEEKAQEELVKREEYYKALEKENALHKYNSKLSSIVKDEKVRGEIAELFANGEYAKAIDRQNEYLIAWHSELEKNIKADLMKEQPKSQPEAENTGMTKEKFKGLSLAEKQNLATKNPELYKRMTN